MDPGAVAAITSATEALHVNAHEPAAWIALGGTYFAHNLFPEAATCFEEALQLHPADARAAYLLAICLDELGRPEARERMIRRAIDNAPSNPAPQWRAAHWALGAGRLEDAEKLAEASLALEEANGSARKVLARVRLAQGEPNAAITTLAPLVQGRQADPYARYLLGRAFQATGDEAEALRQLTLAGDAREHFQDPWLAEVNASRADLTVRLAALDRLLSEMSLEQAGRLLANLQARYGAIRELQLRRAELLAREDRTAEALEVNRKLLQEHPAWGPAMTHRANLALRLFRQDPANRAESLAVAHEAAQQATRRTPGSLDAWEILSMTSAASMDNPAALAAFTRCVELAPNVPRYRAAQAEYMVATGSPEDAETAVRTMEGLFGKTIESELVRIRLLLVQDRGDEALIILARCRQAAPNHPGVRQASMQLMGRP